MAGVRIGANSHGDPWIEIDGDDHEIPGPILDQLSDGWGDYLNCRVYYDSDLDEPFYQNMRNHPRLEEFMSTEADQFLANFEDVDPAITEKFTTILVSKIMGVTVEEIEEFIDHRKNQKPAHSHLH